MDEATAIRRLEDLAPADLDGARRRAKLAARAAFAAPGAPARDASRRLRLRPVLVAALCLLAAAAGLATPPGQAAADWIAEQIGMGQPGGEPTLQQLREWSSAGKVNEGVPAYVVARGPAPYDSHYEIVTWRSEEALTPDFPEIGPRCFEFNMVELRTWGGAGCEFLPASGGLVLDGAGAQLDPAIEYQSVNGRVSADVESVDVLFEGRTIEAEVVPVEEEVREALGFDRPFKTYVAFITDFRHGGTAEIVARDGDGQAVDRVTQEFIDHEEVCRAMRLHLGRDGRPPPC
jgi:hypothetical protein